jgi:threonine dehydratase
VVVPSDALSMKVNSARALGACLITHDRHRDDRDEIPAASPRSTDTRSLRQLGV